RAINRDLQTPAGGTPRHLRGWRPSVAPRRRGRARRLDRDVSRTPRPRGDVSSLASQLATLPSSEPPAIRDYVLEVISSCGGPIRGSNSRSAFFSAGELLLQSDRAGTVRR